MDRPVREHLLPLAARISTLVAKVGTQAKAAKVAGVSARQIRTYVSGRCEPSADALLRLARHTHVRVEWLIAGEGPADTTHAEGERIGKDAYIGVLEAKVARLEAELASLKADVVVRVSAPSIANQRTLIGKLFRALAPRDPKEPA